MNEIEWNDDDGDNDNSVGSQVEDGEETEIVDVSASEESEGEETKS